MKFDTLIDDQCREVESARTITLPQVFTELFLFQISAIISLSGAYF